MDENTFAFLILVASVNNSNISVFSLDKVACPLVRRSCDWLRTVEIDIHVINFSSWDDSNYLHSLLETQTQVNRPGPSPSRGKETADISLNEIRMRLRGPSTSDLYPR